MCGILLIYSKKKSLNISLCKEALSLLDHRGPDLKFDKIEENGKLFLGQTILSITGKPDITNKKFCNSKSNRYSIIFNGEIYNYKKLKLKYLKEYDLASDTDTEVLVNMYEKIDEAKISNKLEGMYALSLIHI